MTNGRRHQDVVVQVYGANTDVGKTVISTGLLRAAAASKEFGAVSYIKPLQTGGADAAFVKKHATEVRTDYSGTHMVRMALRPHPLSRHFPLSPQPYYSRTRFLSSSGRVMPHSIRVVHTVVPTRGGRFGGPSGQ